MSENIKGKVVIITGASSGMGQAAALHLGSLGAKVVLAARRKDRIDGSAKEITSGGGEALAVAVDVTQMEDVQKLADLTIQKFGTIDVLINNAGVMPLSLVESLKVKEWNEMIDVNLRGVLHGVAAVLPHMKAKKSGHIITTASVAGHKVFPGSAVYSATKFAVRAFMEGLRQETTPLKIRTTIVSPGAVKTELLNHISVEEVKKANEGYVGQVGISASSFGRVVAFAISQPEDVDVNEIIFRPTAQEL